MSIKAKCVLFDIDNTLLIKKPTIQEKVYEAARPLLPELTMEDVERAYASSELWQGEQIQRENETGVRMPDGEYLQNILRIYRDALGLPEELPEELRGVFMRNYTMEYEPAPGAAETLEILKARGLSLGIVSNNTPKVRGALEGIGLDRFFGSIVISEEAGLYKPDPAILELACKQLGAAPGESVYVGDHPFDILCAHSAHMPVIWMPVNPYMSVPEHIGPPEHRVESLSEIAGLLE
ncbi:MAG: HAD family hydrolase [Acutalibacter sp.]|uniref:HAD family hydrolase n=1 Tax=Acutalibacter sp. TaxID=1918636 RepID=UPI00217098D9|nr:HAD family hydrolase [Acutalibacter sp.]MCI9225288.1 HAD family hydrolase [Acutalibacter sp.]